MKSPLSEKYPPSEPCSCKICLAYCSRPGWWTVDEASKAIDAGLANRMMLELSPSRDYAVLSPAFRGNEGNFAFEIFSGEGCTFLKNNLCELFGSDIQPLECRFCHHKRKGKGRDCHLDIACEWNSEHAKRLIVKWGRITGFWQRHGYILQEK